MEERARTDREFGGRYGFYGSYCYLFGCSDDIGGVARRDLDQIDMSKPLPAGLELVAEVLLNDNQFVPRLFHSARFDSDPARVFSDFFRSQIDPLKNRLDLEYQEHYVYPTDRLALGRLASTAGIALTSCAIPGRHLIGPRSLPRAGRTFW